MIESSPLTSRIAIVALVLASWLVAASSGASSFAIAVAPFVDSRAALAPGADPDEKAVVDPDVAVRVADGLAAQLARNDLARVVPPGSSGLPAVADPEASQVRGWASEGGHDTIIVGRIFDSEPGSSEGAAWQGLIDVRSGHSGASINRYPIELQAGEDPDEAVGVQLARLSDDILDELTTAEERTALPPVAAPSGSPAGDSTGEEESPFGIFEGDEPIRIDSEELEVVTEDDMRRLEFTRNVRVVQGDVQLHTDYLQAFYPEGSSQPDRLEAKGNVRVFEGDREIRCQRATYEREGSLVICKGDAVLIQGCDEVRGREIELQIDAERIRVIGAASVVFQPKDDEEKECERGTSR